MNDLILKKTFAATTKSMALMNGKLDAQKRTELTGQLKCEMNDYEAQIRQFLGEENYSAFQYFEKAIPDRTMISLFSSRSAGTARALTAAQQEQLAQALSEARGHYNWTTDLSQRNQAAGDYAVMFSEDNLNTFAQEEEQFDRQFLAQAQGILRPEQLAAFADFQNSQRQSQIAGFRMAAKVFAPKSR